MKKTILLFIAVILIVINVLILKKYSSGLASTSVFGGRNEKYTVAEEASYQENVEAELIETITFESETQEETTESYTATYYVINVNLAYNRVTVYTRGEKINDGADLTDHSDDEYDLTPVVSFVCSPGTDSSTPQGRYYLGDRSQWCLMEGDVYAKYATRISDSIMFHSVPYYTEYSGDLKTYEYNILGYDASSGCIRLNCRDAKWIFDNCAHGTEVNIFYDWSSYGPIEADEVYTIPDSLEPLCRWDPTDTDAEGNPWLFYDAYLLTDTIYIPIGSSVDYLLELLGPTDNYGNNLSDYFYTDGGYDLNETGSYPTIGHIKIGNLSFSFSITINVTEEKYNAVDNVDYETVEENTEEDSRTESEADTEAVYGEENEEE